MSGRPVRETRDVHEVPEPIESCLAHDGAVEEDCAGNLSPHGKAKLDARLGDRPSTERARKKLVVVEWLAGIVASDLLAIGVALSRGGDRADVAAEQILEIERIYRQDARSEHVLAEATY